MSAQVSAVERRRTPADRPRVPVDPGSPFALGQLLRSAHHRVSAAMLRGARELGLELRHVAALIELATHGPVSQVRLVAVCDMDKATVVRVIDDLERAGLAARHSHPRDRRVRVVGLTDHGKDTVIRLREIAENTNRLLTASLPADHAAQLLWLLAEFCARRPPAEAAADR